jgi:uncharacterized protein YbaP (TraB family)
VFAGLLGAVALAGHAAAQAGAKKEAERCFLWKVSSKTNTVYLLGSMHVVKPDFFPLPKEIEDSFAASKTLVVELDTEAVNQAQMLKLVFQHGKYPAGETLSKNLSKKTKDALDEYCAKKGMKLEALESLRPWLVNLLLSVGELKAIGMSEDGIDKHFLKKAKADKKPIVELETADAQIKLFADLSADLQEKLLAKTLAEMGDLKGEMEKIDAAWKAGDFKAMDEIMLKSTLKRHPETKALMVKMFDDRNAKMVERIEVMLQGKEPGFVVVGAGHLVGDKGIVKLLEDKKYPVEQVKRAAALKKAS